MHRSPACDLLKQTDPTVPMNATTRDMIAYFARRVANLTASRGLNVGGWEDGLQWADRDEVSTPFNRSDFPNDDVVAYNWYNMWEEGVGGNLYRFANQDYKVSHIQGKILG